MGNPETVENSNKFWRDSDGVLHRTDGPAIEWTDGTKDWWHHGLIHRTDGPAIESADGTTEWWQHGLRHRADGPAVQYSDGGMSWYLDDKCLTFDVWLNDVKMSGEDKVMLKLKYG